MRFGYKHLLISSMVLLSVIFFMPGFAFGAGLTLTICEDCISDKIVVRGTNDLTNNISEYTFLTVDDPNGNQIGSYTFSKS